VGGLAAVDHQLGAGQIGMLVRGERERESGDLLGRVKQF
jgi:hypothetical protein